MKKLILILALALFSQLHAQVQNEKGLYVNEEGDLFSGVVSNIQNGTRASFSVKEGLITGEAFYYFENGKVMESGTFTDGKKDQKWIRYNQNGSISAIAFYKLGLKDSTWIVFDDNGKKRFEMQYTNGAKTGTWINWDENGNVISEKDYTKVN